MADVRMTMAEVAASNDVDRARVAATTDEDIRRYMIEDGEDPDEEPPSAAVRVMPSPASLRARLDLPQAEMARRLRVPLATWRDWEQGRAPLDPVARALLDLVADDPERAFHVLGAHPAAAE